MTAWILVGAGLFVAAVGTTIAVAAAAVSRIELTRWISQRLRGAAVASALLSTPGRVLRAANGLGAIGVLAAGLGVGALLSSLPPTQAAAALFVFGVPALASVAYGIPRAVGRRWCEPIVRKATPWIERISGVFKPLLPASHGVSEADLASILGAGTAEDLLEPSEVKVVSGAVSFTRRAVRDVMTRRTDIAAVEEGTSLEEVGRAFTESGYSRLPVYRDTLDNILGMIYAFDLFKVSPGGELPVRPVAVTPGSKTCADLLLELQRERRQFAVILDEFGGTAGIATLEDLLAALVGGIFDEAEVGQGPDAGELAEVDGATPLGDVAARFGVRLAGDAETIGGFLAREAGRIPRPGERFIIQQLEFDVLAATPTRVERIAVRRGPVNPTLLHPGKKE